ncbi:hypothetical protein SAMN04489712_11983 [Thermomonospora echinospora]|uniref:Uncharacterized protein n=1 Tax=Thermomonospora echinospora TaxID=1992 RepID=A0A1H6DMK3_9ACTN|nr:hypothetical protein SAMN04489712_11983 [Thermomonospora echinospora]
MIMIIVFVCLAAYAGQAVLCAPIEGDPCAKRV